MENKEKLRNQISDSAGNVLYSFSAHWNIVNRLKKEYFWIKIVQIGLVALSTAGIIATISQGVSWLSWLSGLCSAGALFLNLYMLNFNPAEEIKKHTDAANELWDVREEFKSLDVDFDDLSIAEIRNKRDKLNEKIGEINKKYPGTDEKSFTKAQKEINKYQFTEGESEKLLNIDRKVMEGGQGEVHE